MTDEAPQQPTRSFLRLTSRSTHERGTQHCPMARWIEYHAGPYGYGLSRRAMSLPLVTGTYTHLGITSILEWVIEARQKSGAQPEFVPDEVIRWAAELSLEEYKKVCAARGILKLAEGDPESLQRLQDLIREQCYLIEGLIWAWCLVRLPILLRDYTIIAVEEEEEYVLGCTCGAGNGVGTFLDHELRGCNGIGTQSKPDILAERKSDGAYGYFELKTSGFASKGQNEAWERKQQFILGMLGAERRHGVAITHAWVETLIKGKRDRERPYDPAKPKVQMSVFCRAYYRPPNVPLQPSGEWRPGYNYTTTLGEEFTADKRSGFRPTALWDPPEADAWAGKPEEMSVVEYWAKALLQDYQPHLEKQIVAIGPLPRNDEQAQKALRSIEAEENLWQDRLWKIWDFAQQTGTGWGDDLFHEFVETVVPRSWHCDPFQDHPCPNQVICHPQTDDWRRPVESQLFVYRSPHHLAEAEQMRARGLEPPQQGLGEEEGEQDDE